MAISLKPKVTLGSWSRPDLIHDRIIAEVNFYLERSGFDLIWSWQNALNLTIEYHGWI